MHNTMENAALCVPAQPRYARVVRMLAAQLATIDGMTVEEVEDVRMAAEEAFVLTCASGIEDVNVVFSFEGDALIMDFELGEDLDRAIPESFAYADLILQAVCDECVRDDGRLHLVKRAQEARESMVAK